MYVQGVYPPGTFSMLQLPKEWYNALEWQYPPHQVTLCHVPSFHFAHALLAYHLSCEEGRKVTMTRRLLHISMDVAWTADCMHPYCC